MKVWQGAYERRAPQNMPLNFKIEIENKCNALTNFVRHRGVLTLHVNEPCIHVSNAK